MTIIAYDGSACAVDTGALADSTLHRVEKFWLENNMVITGAGNASHVAAMADWFMESADPNDFPPALHYYKDAELVVIDKSGVTRYEASPYPIKHGIIKCAFGEGRDLAYGALAMGATAEEAAVIACTYNAACALPVTVFKWGDKNELIRHDRA